jgi:hypothetical protein
MAKGRRLKLKIKVRREVREKDERKSNELEGSVRQSEDVLGLGWIEFSSGGEQAGGRECKRRYLACVLYVYGLTTRYKTSRLLYRAYLRGAVSCPAEAQCPVKRRPSANIATAASKTIVEAPRSNPVATNSETECIWRQLVCFRCMKQISAFKSGIKGLT